MTPEEFAIARRKIDMTDAELAEELEVSEDVMRAWAMGTRKTPKRHAQWLEWHAAVAERAAALKNAGIEECEWTKAAESKPLPEKDEELEKLEADLKQLEQHSAQCATCQARERFLRERFPPMPDFPQPLFTRGILAWSDVVGGFPRWARTPMLVLPFVLVFGAVGVAVAFVPNPWRLVVVGVLLAIAGLVRFLTR